MFADAGSTAALFSALAVAATALIGVIAAVFKAINDFKNGQAQVHATAKSAEEKVTQVAADVKEANRKMDGRMTQLLEVTKAREYEAGRETGKAEALGEPPPPPRPPDPPSTLKLPGLCLAVLFCLALPCQAQTRKFTCWRSGSVLIINVAPSGNAAPQAYQVPAPADPRLDQIIAQNVMIIALLNKKETPIYVPPGAALPPGYTPAPTPPGSLPPGFTPAPQLSLPPGYVPSPLPQPYSPSPLPPGYAPTPLPPGYAPTPLPGGYEPAHPPVIINVPPGSAPAPLPGYTPAPLPAAPAPAPLPGGYSPSPISAKAPAATPQRYTRALAQPRR